MKYFKIQSILESKEKDEGESVRFLGIIKQIKVIKTKKKQEDMAFVRLEDENSDIETVIFPRKYAELNKKLNKEEIVYVLGIIGKDQQNNKSILVESIQQVQSLYEKVTDIEITLLRDKLNKDDKFINEIYQLMKNNFGNIKVYLNIENKQKKELKVLVSSRLYVNISEIFINSLISLVGDENIVIKVK